ncbi:MAG: formylglycine-generating enzyme family protein [Cyanobacteriota bacterium]|nr:formylglycine-generating enzyme family protein [Cyanobacteriota bacterium]
MVTKTQIAFETVEVDAQGAVLKRETRQRPGLILPLGEGVELTLLLIPAGQGLLGAPPEEEGFQKKQGPQTQITVSAFALGQYPVTQRQWQAVCALPKVKESLDPDCANFSGAERPVEQVTWRQAAEFCQRLARHLDLPLRLPTEGEWEYACRGGTSTPFHFGPTITTDLANYSGVDWEYQGQICNRGAYGQGPLGVDRRETTPADYFQICNPLGLGDLHGNVREWCADPWHPNYLHRPPAGEVWPSAEAAPDRVVRGGSWNRGPQHCRSASRGHFPEETALYDLGFRLALTIGAEI